MDNPCPFARLLIQYTRIRSCLLLLNATIEEILLCGLFNDSGIWNRYGAQNAILAGDDVKVDAVPLALL